MPGNDAFISVTLVITHIHTQSHVYLWLSNSEDKNLGTYRHTGITVTWVFYSENIQRTKNRMWYWVWYKGDSLYGIIYLLSSPLKHKR